MVLAEVELPNGQKYQFKYNAFGEIDKVIYPTGGYERFLYGQVAPLDPDSVYPYSQANRGVLERWVSPSGTGSEESSNHWVYTVGVPFKTTVTAPNGTRTERLLWTGGGGSYFEFVSPLAGMAYEERTYNSSNQMLRRTLTEWSTVTPAGSTQPRNPHLTKNINLILDTGGNALAAATTTQYDADLNPISTNSYDYASIDSTTAQTGAIGSISLGALVRTQETTYLVNDPAISSTIQQNYRDRQLLGLPSSSRVKNAAGTTVAESQVKYDETGFAPLTCGAVTGWTDPGNAVRGMPTTTRSWLNPGGTWLETHAQYDQCGSVRNSTDALGKVSEVAYSGDYQFAYPTSTSSADPDGTGPLTPLTSYTIYDLTSGKVTYTTDANSKTTSYEYAATTPMGQPNQLQRLTKVNRPDGSWTKYNYGYSPGAYFTNTNVSIDATRSTDSYEYADGLGRPRRSFMNEVGTWIVTDTQYDSMGRVWRVSNPYRSTQGEEGTVNPSGEWTSSIYDALGRATTVTTPDSAVVSTYYSGNQVLVKDQAGKERMSQTNALGQLKELWEINSADAWTEDISFPGHAEVTKAYHTSYNYDVLDNLITVSQGVQTRTFVYDSLKRLTSAANPESGTIYYVYDANGNLTKKTDALGVYIDYSYDGLNRSLTKNYSDATPDVTYAYDGVTNSKGHLTSASSSVSVSNYTVFDVMGRATTSTQVTDSLPYSMSYGYNLLGSQISMSYPSGRVVETKYDAAGRMAGVRDQASGLYYAGASESDNTNQMKYAPHGAVSVVKLGNGLWEHTTFNNRLQPTQIGLGTSSTDSSTVGLSYTHGTTNNNGNLLTHAYSGGGLNYTQTFEYDELNRLTTSGEGVGSWSQLNKYDRYGNRWIDLSGTPSLSFNAANNRITNSGYVYDAAGNLTNYSTQSYVFDAENKIQTVNGEGDVYLYDGGGNRVRKNFTYGEKVRMVYSGGQLIAEYEISTGSLKKEYVYGAKGLIATIEPSDVIKYTTADHLGTPRVVTNSSAGLVSRHDYMPFGDEVGSGIGGRTPGMGYDAADGQRQKFTSKERDIETGLDYFNARYYANRQGRFGSPDPLLSSGRLESPQTWNRYSYTLNNPLCFVDPTGLFTISSGVSAAHRILLMEAYDALTASLSDLEVGSKAYKRIERALTRLGKPGEANGIVLTVGATADPRASAETDVNKINKGVVTITFSSAMISGRGTAGRAGDLGHESVHADDARNLFATSKSMRGFLGAWESVRYQTEYNAKWADVGSYEALDRKGLSSYGYYTPPTPPGKAQTSPDV